MIVVGVDGSSGAAEALRFAIAEARLRKSRLVLVAAWQVPAAAYEGGWSMAPVTSADFEGPARAALDEAVAGTQADCPDLTVEGALHEGQAAHVLIAAAHDAELLVVGSRGRGGFKGLILGSVSQQCAHHAPCPVAIVPHPV